MYRSQELYEKVKDMDMQLYPICVPTYNRPNPVIMKSLEAFPELPIILFIRNDREQKKLYSKWRKKCKIVLLDDVHDLGETRAAIINWCIDNHISRIYMMDDDVNKLDYLYPHETPGGTMCMRASRLNAGGKCIGLYPPALKMWQYMISKCDKRLTIAAPAYRPDSWHMKNKDAELVYNHGVCSQCVYINVHNLYKHKINYSCNAEYGVEDYVLQFRAMTAGLLTCTFTDLMYDCPAINSHPGGCENANGYSDPNERYKMYAEKFIQNVCGEGHEGIVIKTARTGVPTIKFNWKYWEALAVDVLKRDSKPVEKELLTEQPPPNMIELNLVEGCFMQCEFCALQGVPDAFSGYKYMKKSTLEDICRKIAEAGWNSKIHIAGHGEPMKHPRIFDCIKLIRKYLKKNPIYLITNGYGMDNEAAHKLFAAGVSNIIISEYTKFPIKKLKAELKKEFKVADWEEKMTKAREFSAEICILAPFEYEAKNSTHKIINRCGVAAPPTHSKQDKRCAKPFRDMFISWNGDLVLCCNDFRKVLNLPNIKDGSINDLWNCEYMQSIRKIIFWDGRGAYPCSVCDNPAYRVGLLPDRMGKKTLSKPTKQDYDTCNNAVLDYPDSGYKARPWEPDEYNKGTYLSEVEWSD